MAQRIDGVELCGFICGVVTEEDAYGCSGTESEQDRSWDDHRAHSTQLAKQPRTSNAGKYTDQPSEQT